MFLLEVPFASPQYDETISLRTRILRDPLGMVFYEKDLAAEWDSIHLAYYDDQWDLLGCLVLKPVSERILKMRQVAVDAGRQKTGVGTALVKASEELARKKGFSIIELHARDSAVPFYTRLDYQIIGDRFEEVGIPHFKMEKSLL
ncbi:MAG: GNAT family N-acetyltransferase [Saprospiraceae bacterium]|nr:GNAT family N-acetyltransferase [Saprospiraceae bacterium]